MHVQHEYASFTVIGQAKSHMAYLDGGDSMMSGIESMDSKPAEVVDPGKNAFNYIHAAGYRSST